jgi:GntR family transcriptional regulator, transcriptional repressor for pyruvate dehydrogenase complex
VSHGGSQGGSQAGSPPARRRRVVEQVATSLREAIVGGRLSPGDPLPSERELASKFEVNRSSVREALHRLEAWGLVEIRHGGATRVRDFLVNAGLQVLPFVVESPGGRLDPQVLQDVHEIRAMLLGWCGEQAALKADAAAVERLRRLAAALEAPGVKAATLQKLDYDFFEELVKITGNRMLAFFANVVREIYLKNAARFEAMYRPGVFDPGHHRRAVLAIHARNAAKAGAAMRAHAESALSALEESP